MNKRLIFIFWISVLALTACAGNEEPLPSSETDISLQQVAVTPTITPIPEAEVAQRPTVTVQRGAVQEVLEFTGQWLPRDQQELSFPVAGSVRSVTVRRGDSVTAGQLIADFQIEELENQLDSALISLESAQRRLETGGTGSADAVESAQFSVASANLNLESAQNSVPWTSVASARQSLDAAQRNLEDARRSYDDARSNLSNSAAAVDNAYNAIISAQDQVNSAQIQYYSAAQSYNNYQYQIASAQNQQLQAQFNLEDAIEGVGVDQDLVDNVRTAQLNVDQILEKIAQSSLYAPFDGVVLEVTISPGDAVQAYNSVMTIALPEPKEIIANLSFNDTQQLDIGKLGVCQLANQPDSAVQCIVRNRPFTSQDADQSTRIAADFPGELALGQLIEVTMPLETIENALWLPPNAIRTFQSRTFVVIRTPEGEQVVDVTLGLQTDDRVEILSGVAEGDAVVLP